MATPQQRAARKRRRQARASRKRLGHGKVTHKPGKGKRGPIFRNPQPVGMRAKGSKRVRSESGKLPLGSSSSISMVTDGVNMGSVWKTPVVRTRYPVHREKVTDLTSASTAFAILQQLYLNPGNSSLFPIFSQEAACYEQYIPNVLRFYFRTEEYMANASYVSAGLVGMAVNFDANDPNFGNITSLENYEQSISGPPFSGILLLDVLEHWKNRYGKNRDLATNSFYVYNSANSVGPSSDQAKWYDVGNLQVAVNGTQAALVGELWVEYSFTLLHRKQPEFPIGGQSIHLKSYQADATNASPLGLTAYTTMNVISPSESSSGVAPGSTLSVSNMSGDLAFYTSSTIGLDDSVDTAFSLPNVDGTWFVYVQWSQGTGVSTIPALTASGGASVIPTGPGGLSLKGFFLAAGTSSTIAGVVATTRDTAPASSTNRVSLSGNTGMTGMDVDIYVLRLPNDLITLNVDQREQIEIEDLQGKVQALSLERDQMMTRLLRLEGLLSPPSEVEVELPEECKASDGALEKSVHLNRSAVAKLLGLK